jgi:hypothetical protein
MNVEEARKVLWLKSNPRPFGELLDEGYLNQERLEWAAQWAYNFKLKEAAQVLLDAMKTPTPQVEEVVKPVTTEIQIDNSIPINMTLDKAREMPWPFPPYKGQPMGTLVESKQLSLKDLGYAVDNAWNEKVKQAAIALSLVRLEQVVKEPAPSAGFVHVISGGRSYSEQRQYRLTLQEGMVFGISLSLLVYLIWELVQNAFRPHPNTPAITEFVSSPTQMSALLLLFVLFVAGGWFLVSIPDRITQRLDKQIEEHRLGQEGEDNVVQMIVQVLDGNWHLFRNMALPGRNKGDLDVILVGPPGVWVLEVKNFRGKYRNKGDDWQFQKGGKWKPTSKSPSKQAFNNAMRLSNFLSSNGLKVFVNPVVVWASVTSPLFLEHPSTPVWYYKRLPDEIGNIWHGEKLSDAERNRVAAKITTLCERNKKSR